MIADPLLLRMWVSPGFTSAGAAVGRALFDPAATMLCDPAATMLSDPAATIACCGLMASGDLVDPPPLCTLVSGFCAKKSVAVIPAGGFSVVACSDRNLS